MKVVNRTLEDLEYKTNITEQFKQEVTKSLDLLEAVKSNRTWTEILCLQLISFIIESFFCKCFKNLYYIKVFCLSYFTHEYKFNAVEDI